MIHFIDGPARGISLKLMRTPVVLRVVARAQKHRGNEPVWDALDQLDDTPQADETIYVYRLVGTPFRGFIDCRGKDRHRSGAFVEARYKYLKDQPVERHLRTNDAWAQWCRENQDRLTHQFQAEDQEVSR